MATSKNQKECPICENDLEKINNLHIVQFDFSLNSEIILKNIRIDELYKRQQDLEPSDYSREYQIAHEALKKDFHQILSII